MTSTSLDAGVEEALPAPSAPTRLRVEHLREAMGITITRSRLSWTLPWEQRLKPPTKSPPASAGTPAG
jgi:alpha-L-rhamnosidase